VAEQRKFLHLDDQVFELQIVNGTESLLSDMAAGKSTTGSTRILIRRFGVDEPTEVPLHVNFGNVRTAFIADFPDRPESFV
jgi:hypothetical protein